MSEPTGNTTMGGHPNDQLLERALERWRQRRLQAIGDQMIALNQDLRLAQDGLGIAHRNPGEVAEDIIDYQWERLNRSAMGLAMREDEHQQLMEMDLAQLLITYKRKRKDKPRWAFQSY